MIEPSPARDRTSELEDSQPARSDVVAIPPTSAAASDDAPAAADPAVARGISWLYWTVALSVLNVVTMLFGAEWSFALSLTSSSFLAVGARQAMRHEGAEFLAPVFLILAIAPIAIVFGMTRLARGGARPWALALAAGFLVLDGVVALALDSWIAVALRAFCVFQVFRAWRAAPSQASRDGSDPRE